MHAKLSILGAAAVLVVGLAVIATASHAQYPPPEGSVIIESESTTTEPGDETLLTCEVVDEEGEGIPSVPCTFTITSQPGTDAAVGSISVTKITNAEGVVTTTLHVGSTPGIIVVEAKANGFSSSVLVTVDGEAPSPPQAPVNNIQPPSTGSGGLAH